ncbi:lantibiotic immunity ABC transporter MutG family permease subunit [Clostridium sp. UBA1056]|uniref:lantibiotic immunity ABC transporter MutG family permease subunit n=1 Tax=unclassified Clostridium TaxID=2614128 RepID=UPI0032175424
MKTFFRFMRADFQKIRHTPMLWIHIVVPILTVTVFLSYYSFSTASSFGKVGGYMEALAIAFPLLIGILSAMAVEQEASAGHFQELLIAKYKLMSFFSKVCTLLLLGFGSLFITVGGFAFGFKFLLHQNLFSSNFYGKMILILFFSQIFLYLLHILCSFRFGSGASIGLGIAESLVAALMLTGLGEGIWMWIPCGWGVRFSDYYISWNTNNGGISILMEEFQSGALICFVMTVLLLLSSFIWFHYFEGRNED